LIYVLFNAIKSTFNLSQRYFNQLYFQKDFQYFSVIGKLFTFSK